MDVRRGFRVWMRPQSGKVKRYGKDEIVDVVRAGGDVYKECPKRAFSAGWKPPSPPVAPFPQVH